MGRHEIIGIKKGNRTMSVTPYEFRNQYSKRVVMIDDSLRFVRCRMAVWQSIHSSQHFQKVYIKPYHQS